MNCRDYKKQILLAESGELSDRTPLMKHLEACASCRTFSEMQQLTIEVAREHLPTATPHPSVMVAIRKAAETRHHGVLIAFPSRLIAYAALFMAIAGTTTWISTTPIRQRATRISTLSTIVAIVSETIAEDEGLATLIEDDSNLEAVAQQLLEMQGFAIGDWFSDEEDPILDDQPDPTTTQWHKTHAPLAGTCV